MNTKKMHPLAELVILLAPLTWSVWRVWLTFFPQSYAAASHQWQTSIAIVLISLVLLRRLQDIAGAGRTIPAPLPDPKPKS